MIFLASDHAGFKLKGYILERLNEARIVCQDLGTFSSKPVDYPPYAKMLSRAVLHAKGKGILLCSSGEGMAIVANRIKGIRAAVAWNPSVAREAREDNDINVLSLPAKYLDDENAWRIVSSFLSTTFGHEDRHKRRIHQIDEE